MRIAVGADHRGFRLKEFLKKYLSGQGHLVSDLGTYGPVSADYPDYAFPVAEAVGKHRVERGILVCGTGIGMCLAANRVTGVRAAACTSSRLARMSRLHNDANVLCLAGDLLTRQLATRIVAVWLRTPFEGGRHRRRLAKVSGYRPRRRR